MTSERQRVRVAAPAGMDRLELVDAVAGDDVLAKAQRKYSTKTFRREPALDQISARFATAYDAVLDKMFREIVRYIGEKIVGTGELRKAASDDDEAAYGFVANVDWPDDDLVAHVSGRDPTASPYSATRFMVERKLSLLTPRQLEDIKAIIRNFHAAFAIGMFGPDSLPPGEAQRLIDMGVMPQDLAFVLQPAPGELPPQSLQVTDLAYQYGQQLGQPEQRDAVRQMGADQFLEHLENTRPTLSPVDRQAMAFARYNGAEHVTGMADRFCLETGTLIRNADAEQRRRYMGVIQKELEDNIDRSKTWRQLASDIGHATKDWSRDMGRLGATEKQFAMQEGQARQIAKGYEDPAEARVAKQPSPDACPDCVRLHLTAGQGSAPRIFSLAELHANGTNVGIKRPNWRATVGPVHPWCGCELVEVPDGWAFDADGTMLPESMLEKGDRLDAAYATLSKGHDAPHMTHGDAVPEDTIVVRVGDPRLRQVIEAVLAEAPPEIFHKDVGVTLITTDSPRVQNPLEDHDFAYWTANEIRLNQTLPIERVPRVLRHELGHSLNVHLMRKLGSTAAVRAWHDELYALSEEEGFVSDYARKLPIENAAEATRMYLFEKPRLMLNHPGTFAFLHRHYRDIWKPR